VLSLSTIHHSLSPNLSNAYLLVSHGSRDPRPQAAVSELAQQLNLCLGAVAPATSPILVGTAQLELAAQPLYLQISDFACRCKEVGIVRMVILPLFLIPGVHAIEDIPAEVLLAQNEIGNLVKLIIAPFLGTSQDLANLFAQQRDRLPSQSIMMAHGSRKSGGNAIVEQLASNLELQPAYWSIDPSLADLVNRLIANGATEIGILPYFLFAGGITDAIEKLVSELSAQHPQVQLRLGEPIGNSPELVSTIDKILGMHRQTRPHTTSK
jgi:sirohydrochlorin cobaltochelatase